MLCSTKPHALYSLRGASHLRNAKNLTPFTPFAALRARFGRQGCGFNPIFACLYGRQGCGLNPGSSNGLSRRLFFGLNCRAARSAKPVKFKRSACSREGQEARRACSPIEDQHTTYKEGHISETI